MKHGVDPSELIVKTAEEILKKKVMDKEMLDEALSFYENKRIKLLQMLK